MFSFGLTVRLFVRRFMSRYLNFRFGFFCSFLADRCAFLFVDASCSVVVCLLCVCCLLLFLIDQERLDRTKRVKANFWFDFSVSEVICLIYNIARRPDKVRKHYRLVAQRRLDRCRPSPATVVRRRRRSRPAIRRRRFIRRLTNGYLPAKVH